MPDDVYHADPSLGSTDIRRLRNTPEDWYWHSAYNPMSPGPLADDDDDVVPLPEDEEEDQWIKKGDARAVGKAVHKYVLEGCDAFDATYVRRPAHVKKKSDKMARIIAPHGEVILHSCDYDRAIIASAMIAKNPKLGKAFVGGFPEVSVFWVGEFDGRQIPFKVRHDYLKPNASVDLKSIRNSREIPFKEACLRRIAEHRLDIQAEHYCEGRRQMHRLLDAGAVHDCPDPVLLQRIVERPDVPFCFVFFAASGAPLTYARMISPENPGMQVARNHIDAALAKYVACAEQYGFNDPWLLVEDVEELDINDLPAWTWR